MYQYLEQRRLLTARSNADALLWATLDATPAADLPGVDLGDRPARRRGACPGSSPSSSGWPPTPRSPPAAGGSASGPTPT